MAEKVLFKNINDPKQLEIETCLKNGGYNILKKALSMKPEALIEEVKKSNLRGRGGAGFPTGMKWSFIPKAAPRKYLVCNADEGEPGTFKDRVIIEKDPHLLLEGIIISSYAIGAYQAYIYIRGEFVKGARILEKAISDAYKNGFLGKNILNSGYNLDVIVHRGAGAYICGEETALLESIEGKRGLPRVKPPFPAQVGLFGCPTVINNVETLAAVPAIVAKGGDWYAGIGKGKSTGTKLFSISGPVKKPGVYEVDLGYPFKNFFEEYAGGMLDGKKLKAVIPGGSSTPVLTAEEAMNVALDYESLQSAGSMLGSGAIIIIDDKTCMVDALYILVRFYHHESCGQCTPCREGSGWIEKVLHRIEKGKGVPGDVELIESVANNIMGRTLCPFGDALAMPVLSFVKKFRHEFIDHAAGKICGRAVARA
ncbi:MAG TPA: NADH-quinone oxidoreductase subunit NuoF [bacterium]